MRPSRAVDELEHPFVARPHRTLLLLSLPVLGSMIAEPLAGLADTAFVARLGVAELAAVGVATTLLSSALWVFNFLGIGTQTEVAQALGEESEDRAGRAASLALAVAAALGLLLAAAAWPALDAAAGWMTDDAEVRALCVRYLEIRLLGAPPMLVALVGFGALRGLQDMRTPLWIAGAMSAANVALDPLLIFGAGPVPRMGVAGAAWATTLSQIGGAAWVLGAVAGRLRLARPAEWSGVVRLLVVGRDLVIRTAALLAFQLVATRVAVRAGLESGAAHQGVRQVWMLLAFMLDAFAVTAQSLIGYFMGARDLPCARRVAGVACAWGVGAGSLLGAAMLVAEPGVAWLLVPPEARDVFAAAWLVCAMSQPLNALSFVTDGVHWGTGDYAYLRNAMLVSTTAGVIALGRVDLAAADALAWVWGVTALWIALRAVFGIVRIWPGIGAPPLQSREEGDS